MRAREGRDVRNEEVHQTVLEQEAHELGPAALDANDTLVRRQQQDDKVEAHGVDECGCEDGVVRARHDAALAGHLNGVEQNTLENERPVAEDDDNDRDDDALVVRPERHSVSMLCVKVAEYRGMSDHFTSQVSVCLRGKNGRR